MRSQSISISAITGAFGFSGRHITHRLLSRGQEVITLTSKPPASSHFGKRVRAFPLDFDDPSGLTASLEGVSTLYNTYWVRFNYGAVTYERAVENTLTLIRAAREAGVKRLVHISISNPSLTSPLPYFRGKAEIEAAIVSSGLSYAILRPTVIFGDDGILINNIAYLLRRFPFFAIPGDGAYRLQPIYVEDLADLAVKAANSSDNLVLEAAGPEVFSFSDLVHLISAAVGSRARLIHLPPRIALGLARVAGVFTRDVILTRDELDGLMAELLVAPGRPAGWTCFSDWLKQQAPSLGRVYASELKRHYIR